jgi:HNH endonuclease
MGGVYGHVPLNFLSRMLRDRYGNRCSQCGWSERHPTTGKIPVEVEHIDGDWRNNRPENLALLCPNCHALTPTFRALNEGEDEHTGSEDGPIR